MAARSGMNRSFGRFRIVLRLLTALILAVCAAPLIYAQADAHASVKAQHLTVSLLVPPAQVSPGQSFLAGLDFKLEDGWHVYWTNAGDSGEPPNIAWKLPQGITAGPMQFPPPKRLPLGPLMDFGYENEVVFPLPMHLESMQAASPTFEPNPVPIAAHVTWLVCREVCIPGKADL